MANPFDADPVDLDGSYEGTRLEHVGTDVTLWIDTRLKFTRKTESRESLFIDGEGIAITNDGNRIPFRIKGSMSAKTRKVKLTQMFENDTILAYTGELRKRKTIISLHDTSGAEVCLERTEEEGSKAEEEDDASYGGFDFDAPAMSAPMSTSSPAPSPTASKIEKASKSPRAPATSSPLPPPPMLSESMSSSTKDADRTVVLDTTKEENAAERATSHSTPSSPAAVVGSSSTSKSNHYTGFDFADDEDDGATKNAATPKSVDTTEKIGAELLKRQRMYEQRAKQTLRMGSSEQTDEYLEAVQVLRAARAMLVQDEAKYAMFDPDRLSEVEELVKGGIVKEEVYLRLKEVGRQSKPEAFRWDLLPPDLDAVEAASDKKTKKDETKLDVVEAKSSSTTTTTTTSNAASQRRRTNPFEATTSDVGLTRVLRDIGTEHKDALTTTTTSAPEDTKRPESVSLSRGISRRSFRDLAPVSENASTSPPTKTTPGRIDSYVAPSMAEARVHWQSQTPHVEKTIDTDIDIDSEITLAESAEGLAAIDSSASFRTSWTDPSKTPESKRKKRKSGWGQNLLPSMIAYMYREIGKRGGQQYAKWSEMRQLLVKKYGWSPVERHARALQTAMDRVNATIKHTTCGSRTGRFCRPRKICGESMELDFTRIDPFHEGCASEFEKYGGAVSSYFKILKFLGWTFLLLQLVYIPCVAMNASSRSSSITLTSLSNLVDIRSDVLNASTNATVITVFHPEFDGLSDPTDLLSLYVAITCVGASLLVAASLWLDSSLEEETKLASSRVVTVADFSVKVTGLPETNLTRDELVRFFEGLSLKVFDIRIARADAPLIDLFKRRGAIVRELRSAHQRVLRGLKVRASPWEINKAIRRRNRALQRIRKHDASLRLCLIADGRTTPSHVSATASPASSPSAANYEMAAFSSKGGVETMHSMGDILDDDADLPFSRRQLYAADMAVAAFVTFDSVGDRRKALELFRDPPLLTRLLRMFWCDCVCCFCCGGGRRGLKLRGTHRLRLRVPPPPSTINWEFLQYPYFRCLSCRSRKRYEAPTFLGRVREDRCTRHTCTTAAGVLLLLFAFAAGVGFRYEERRATSEWLDSDCTTAEIHSIPASCAASAASFAFANVTLSNTTHALRCYCSEHFLDSFSCCLDGLGSDVWLYILGYPFGLALLILVANETTRQLLTQLEFLDMHTSLDSGAVATSKRLFYLQVLSSVAILLLLPGPNEDLFFVDPETWSKRLFSPSWYLDVSSTYVLYVALFLVSPWLYDVCVFVLDRCTRSGRIKDAATQQELNEAGLGGVFYVEYRYAMMLTMVCVVLAFAPAEPVVFGVAALALYVWFYADKWLFCNYFRVPPRYSATGLPALFGTLFRDAICLHVIAAVFIFSDETIFPSSIGRVDGRPAVTYVGDAAYPPQTLLYRIMFDPNPNDDWMRPGLFRDEVVPLLWFAMGLVVHRIVEHMFGAGVVLRTMCWCVCCCRSHRSADDEDENDGDDYAGSRDSYHPTHRSTDRRQTRRRSTFYSGDNAALADRTTFWGMVARDKVDGLYSYSLFDNERYRSYFNVSAATGSSGDAKDPSLSKAVVDLLSEEYAGGNFRYHFLRDPESACCEPKPHSVEASCMYFALPTFGKLLRPKCCRAQYAEPEKSLERHKSLREVVVSPGGSSSSSAARPKHSLDDVVDRKVAEEEDAAKNDDDVVDDFARRHSTPPPPPFAEDRKADDADADAVPARRLEKRRPPPPPTPSTKRMSDVEISDDNEEEAAAGRPVDNSDGDDSDGVTYAL